MVFFILFFFFVVVVFTVLALCIGITFIRVSAEQFTRFGLLVDLTDLVVDTIDAFGVPDECVCDACRAAEPRAWSTERAM